eukprot:m.464542 g.464542  ORF g.464542 m.464542 type:complete len:98 (+) comp21620_c0_seq5:119-412(+)
MMQGVLRVGMRATANAVRAFRGSGASKRMASSEASGPQPPNGFLWGQKPGTVSKETWEVPYKAGIIGGLVLAGFLLSMKPDTSTQTWGREEAQKRLA